MIINEIRVDHIKNDNEIKNILNLKIDENKLNFIQGAMHSGKSLLFRMVSSTLGNNALNDSVFGENGIKNDFSCYVTFTIKNQKFTVKRNFIRNAQKDKKINAYTVFWEDEANTFISTEEFTEYVFKKIRYPRYVTWEYDSKKTMIGDLQIPIFFKQTKSHSLIADKDVKYKKANRTALSIAFLSNKYDKEINHFYENREILENFNSKEGRISNTVVETIKKIAKDNFIENDEDYKQYKNLIDELESLRSFIKEKSDNTNIGKYNANLALFDVVIREKLKLNNFQESQIFRIRDIFEKTWFISIETSEKEKEEIKAKMKDLRDKIKKLEVKNHKLVDKYMSNDFAKKILENTDEKNIKKDDDNIEEITKMWTNIYFQVRKECSDIFGNINEPFVFDQSNEGNNFVNKIVNYCQFIKDAFNIENVFIDSLVEAEVELEDHFKHINNFAKTKIKGVVFTTNKLENVSIEEDVNIIKLENWLPAIK